jgi:hypothetical protein
VRALLVAAALLLTACSETAPPAPPPAVPSALGGEIGSPAEPPGRPMIRVEQTIAADLSRRLGKLGMGVDYLDCPRLDAEGPDVGRQPRALTCRAYLEGVVAAVEVTLWGPARSPHYDALLGESILATANLVRRLEAEGYTNVDCGSRSAYPSVLGDRIVCRVTEDDRSRYVVATVTSSRGEVAIGDY